MQPSLQLTPGRFTAKQLDDAASAALLWLERCIAVNAGSGASAYRHLWRGWAPPYPETTGYLIETLFDYAHIKQDVHLKELALSCAEWLLEIQLESGAFPGGLGIQGPPILFDTGQILFGLTRAYAETNDLRYLEALKKTAEWLLLLWEQDARWQQYAYVPGYEPSYYTRVIWAMLFANQYLNSPALSQSMQAALEYYAARITPQYSVRDWGFKPGDPAFTHTIAYTIRGFLESAVLLGDAGLLARARELANRLLQVRQAKGLLAGAYDENWNGNYRFICLTGNVQCSLIFSRLFEITGDRAYRSEAEFLLESVLKRQRRNGALAGSFPIWGAYMPFRYPNWALKFFLDAIALVSRN